MIKINRRRFLYHKLQFSRILKCHNNFKYKIRREKPIKLFWTSISYGVTVWTQYVYSCIIFDCQLHIPGSHGQLTVLYWNKLPLVVNVIAIWLATLLITTHYYETLQYPTSLFQWFIFWLCRPGIWFINHDLLFMARKFELIRSLANRHSTLCCFSK